MYISTYVAVRIRNAHLGMANGDVLLTQRAQVPFPILSTCNADKEDSRSVVTNNNDCERARVQRSRCPIVSSGSFKRHKLFCDTVRSYYPFLFNGRRLTH